MVVQKKTNRSSTRSSSRKPQRGLAVVLRSPRFGWIYAGLSVLVLLATTLWWSVLGAHLQHGNADQLVNSMLFEHANTFRGAQFPSQHTFLLKWPLFWLVKLFGASAGAFTVFTAAIALFTVASLAGILYRIERRPLVFGTLCLALASVLLLVPAQPYVGGLLPVNMAMLATRNLEYIVYIMSLILLVRSPKLRSVGFWLAVGCMSLLIASDKLFLVLSIGGALSMLVVYAVAQGWKAVSLAVSWLIGSVLAAGGGLGVLWLINATKLTHIVSYSSTGPYSLVTSLRELMLGSLYGVLGLLTNFGANPAYSATIVRTIPHVARVRLLALGGGAYLINVAIVAIGLGVACRLVLNSVISSSHKKRALNKAQSLSLMLIWTTLVTIVVFIASNHYYAVDARYLTISLFAVFITAATWTRAKRWQPEHLVVIGGVVTIGIILGLTTVGHGYKANNAAFTTVTERNTLIAQVLHQHPVDVLVGDYWRVIPAKQASGGILQVLPLSSCGQPQQVLTSSVWQPDLNNHSFAYLLSLDRGLTNYPMCTLNQTIGDYGRPNASTVIAGTLSHPKELLLFYDHGIRKSAAATPAPSQGPATVVPVRLDQLPPSTCTVPTIMNIVAHQDDDLLFMNPDLLHDMHAGHCVRTIYITAGDDGAGKFYWLSREQGSEAAYDAMDGPTQDVWIQKIVELSDHEFITIASPKGNPKVSLIFMHLPDGNLNGQGFESSYYESLARLEAGQVRVMHAVDGQSTYTSAELVAALTSLMHTYQPSEIRTQANYLSHDYPDHSDHMAVGRFTQQSYAQYEMQQYGGQVVIPLSFYVGYPVHGFPANVSGTDLAEKETAFLRYAAFDSSVCRTTQECAVTPTYNAYLHRQYQNDK